MSRYARIFFFLLLISIPIQLGKHFWPSFSFVQGIRVDYLSPTLYVSDGIFIGLLIFSLKELKSTLFIFCKSPVGITLIATLLISSFFAHSYEAALWGIIKFCEFSYLAVYVSHAFRKRDLELTQFILILGALAQSVILILQFFAQSSLGGAFYFFGERTFTSSTPGIATFTYGTQELLRPYGTFPHPNVLAFYLLFVFILALFSLHSKDSLSKLVKVIVLSLLAVGIFFTFSRIIILLVSIIVLTAIYRKAKKQNIELRRAILLIVIIALLFLTTLLFQRFGSTYAKDLALRYQLGRIAFEVFLKSPLLGVGLNNFYYHEIDFQKNVSAILLQPVHNIYLLWIVQTGISGFILSLFLVKLMVLKLRRSIVLQESNGGFYKSISLIIICILIAGMFDHYFLTLQQGQILLALTIGFSFSKVVD